MDNGTSIALVGMETGSSGLPGSRVVTVAFDLRGWSDREWRISNAAARMTCGAVCRETQLTESATGCPYSSLTVLGGGITTVPLNVLALRHLELSRGGFFTLDVTMAQDASASSSLRSVELAIAVSERTLPARVPMAAAA
jgi:hypothetical protein